MSSPSGIVAASPWEEEGRRIAEQFDGHSAIVLVATQPADAAQVALGIGRVQARRRRVAIADAVGEVAPLQRLLPRDAVHGLVDSFQYGVSLSKIAYPIDPAQNLYIMPSGAGALDHGALLSSERWQKLANGFREVDALLMIVAPADAPGVPDLLRVTDGVVLVGRGAMNGLEPVIAEVRLPGHDADGTAQPLGGAEPQRRVDALPVQPDAGGNRAEIAAPPRVVLPSADPPPFKEELRRRTRVFAGGIAAVLVILVALTWWLARDNPGAAPVPAQSAPGARPTSQSGALAVDVTVANPADSASAAAWGVELSMSNTLTSAISALEQQESKGVAAATIAPVFLSGATWFRLEAGAFATSAGADSLLRDLRAGRIIPATTGRTVYTPFALRVETNIARDNAAALVKQYRGRGLAVYALLKDDGSADLFAGAFETPDQAVTLLQTFHASGASPVVVYRVGRLF